MSADTLVTLLNSLYLVPMVVVSLVGTAALLKFIGALVISPSGRRPSQPTFLEVEDA